MHFPVLVVGENIDGQLAPFQENNMGDCPDQYLEKDDEGGLYNPNSQWDWYVVGGRWNGFFKLKKNKKEYIHPEFLPKELRTKRKEFPGGVNSALKKDIDFTGMREYRLKLAEKIWNRFMNDKNKYIRLTDEMKLRSKLGISPNATQKSFKGRCSLYCSHILWEGEWFGELNETEYYKKLEKVGNDELLTVVDCHT